MREVEKQCVCSVCSPSCFLRSNRIVGDVFKFKSCSQNIWNDVYVMNIIWKFFCVVGFKFTVCFIGLIFLVPISVEILVIKKSMLFRFEIHFCCFSGFFLGFFSGNSVEIFAVKICIFLQSPQASDATGFLSRIKSFQTKDAKIVRWEMRDSKYLSPPSPSMQVRDSNTSSFIVVKIAKFGTSLSEIASRHLSVSETIDDWLCLIFLLEIILFICYFWHSWINSKTDILH